MRIGLLMDASCDLPQEYVAAHPITVLPVHVNLDGQVFDDRRDKGETLRFLERQEDIGNLPAHTEPYSDEQIQALFLEHLVTRFDCVFCLTASGTRSSVHANVTRASFGIVQNYREARQAAGVQGPFLLRVVDTQTLCAGAAVPVTEAVRLVAAGKSSAQIRERLEEVSRNTYGYLLPRDLRRLHTRSRARGERGVSLLGSALGSTLDIKPILCDWRGTTSTTARLRGFETAAQALFGHTAQRIRQGLMVPSVCLSYGGRLEDLRALPGYAQVPEACRDCGVDLLESPMSITGMVNAGTGALSVGFACEEYRAEF